MSTYVIGDLQGCLEPLLRLIDKINFDPSRDELWFAGDLVNRGTQSLEVLRFLYEYRANVRVVLGNHDLHLLGLAHGVNPKKKPYPTLQPIINAHDGEILLNWLCEQPLLLTHTATKSVIVHAGLHPIWGYAAANTASQHISHFLQNPQARRLFLSHLYGDMPKLLTDSHNAWEKLRWMTNVFTRMRYVYPDGRLDFECKLPPSQQPMPLVPWFMAENAIWRAEGWRAVFGHWSSLGQVVWSQYGAYGLDTGCQWGNLLTALRLESLNENKPELIQVIGVSGVEKPKKKPKMTAMLFGV